MLHSIYYCSLLRFDAKEGEGEREDDDVFFSLLGPKVLACVSHPILFMMLGNIGLILLVIKVGIDINLTTLKLIGSRGLIISVTGSILPILLAFLLALAIGTYFIGSLAAGAWFSSPSLGIS